MATDQRERAAELRSRYDQAATNIRADSSLSDSGKVDRLADEWTKAATGTVAARVAHVQARATRQAELRRSLFGLTYRQGEDRGQAAVGYRDAVERAERTKTPAEAQALLERARMTGDDVQARAVGLVAAERAWSDVLLAWVDKRPEDRAALDELGGLTDRPSQERFMESVAFGLPPRPSEVPARDLPTPIAKSAS